MREHGQFQSVRYRGEVPHLFDTLLYGPVAARALAGAAGRPPPAVRQRARLRRLSARRCSSACSSWCEWGRSDDAPSAAAIQVLGGLALAPLLPGTIQTLKARLQGRRGPSPLQPYRELRRLWGKSLVDPQPTTVVYRLAPCLVAAATVLALLLVPIAGISPDWPLGNDALVLVGLLALARFALAAASWDTGSGFALMGSSRDLTLVGLRRGAAGAGVRPRRAARRQHRPGLDERRRERLGDLGRARPLVRRARPSPSSSWSRPGGSRSTTPTPTSS